MMFPYYMTISTYIVYTCLHMVGGEIDNEVYNMININIHLLWLWTVHTYKIYE